MKRAFLAFAFLAAAVCGTPQTLRADLILAVEHVGLLPSSAMQTGTFEVYVNSGLEPQPDVIAWQVRLNLAPATSGVSFVGYDKPVDHPYVLPGGDLWAGSISPDGAQLEAGDMLITGQVPLVDGAGLVRVTFEVAGGTPPGVYDVSIDAGFSYIADDGYAFLPYEASHGRITIIPEPSTPAMLLLAAFFVGLSRRRRRHVSAR